MELLGTSDESSPMTGNFILSLLVYEKVSETHQKSVLNYRPEAVDTFCDVKFERNGGELCYVSYRLFRDRL